MSYNESYFQIKGLQDAQVERNRELYGRNALIPPPKPSKILQFFKCVFGGLNLLLWGCAVLSYGSYVSQFSFADFISTDNVRDRCPSVCKIHNTNEKLIIHIFFLFQLFLGCSIVIVVHVSGAFEFYQQFKSDRIMESFKNMVPHFATVTRNGRKFDIPVEDMVVGDIVEIKYGSNQTSMI